MSDANSSASPSAVASVCLPACLAELRSCLGVTRRFSVRLQSQGQPTLLAWLCSVRRTHSHILQTGQLSGPEHPLCHRVCGIWCSVYAVAAVPRGRVCVQRFWYRWQLRLEPSSEAAESGSTRWVEQG